MSAVPPSPGASVGTLAEASRTRSAYVAYVSPATLVRGDLAQRLLDSAGDVDEAVALDAWRGSDVDELVREFRSCSSGGVPELNAREQVTRR